MTRPSRLHATATEQHDTCADKQSDVNKSTQPESLVSTWLTSLGRLVAILSLSYDFYHSGVVFSDVTGQMIPNMVKVFRTGRAIFRLT